MQSLQTRIDSFHKAKRVKRYPNKPSSSTASVKWPHPLDFKANANTLAEAGFFFSPSWDDRDSVACFLCGKELSDWDADDDPFEIHYNKCRDTCPWAVVRCGLTKDLDNKGRFVFNNKTRFPSGKAMEKARLETFGHDWWPHDNEPGHGATSVKMAQAGFVYTPQTAGDDTVTCLYCNLSLGGWETEDDPVQEHRRRDSKSGTTCPLLAFSEQQSEDELAAVHVADPPPPRTRRGKARPTTATSKGRRRTKVARGKSSKVSVPARQSPSPSQADSHDQDTNTTHKSGSLQSLPDGPVFPSTPSAPHNPNAWPNAAPSHPDLIVSLSPAGQPIIANSQFLTDHERTMTLEEWIRQEIEISYERLLTDGRRQIELFKTKATELRNCIDGL